MNLGAIKKDLLNSENSSIISTSPPALSTNTSSPENSSAYKCKSLESTQDTEILDILEELLYHEPCIRTSGTRDGRLQAHFCSDTVFNLSNWVFSANEIKVLEKGLHFRTIQQKINEPELRKAFEEFCSGSKIFSGREIYSHEESRKRFLCCCVG